MSSTTDDVFPRLTSQELEVVRDFSVENVYADGDIVFRAGQAEIDFLVIDSGALAIVNPTDGNRHIVTHMPGQFAGDIDLITGRPVIVTAIAKGETRLLRVARGDLRQMLNRLPSLGEKLFVAFMRRRELLAQMDALGLRVIGSGQCRDTNVVREFLHKNFVPFIWMTPDSDRGRKALAECGSPTRTPVIECTNGTVLVNPSLRDLAEAAGVWRECPTEEMDLTIVGAGPAGITTAVYAASEGLSTLLLDRLGPGGQAGGSSRIENFIGFPAGLSGTELATRGVLQLLKFGARIAAPVQVDRLIPAKDPDDLHVLQLDCGAKIRSRVVLIATGVRWRKLEVEGVDRFHQSGVYYACTTVEAGLYDKSDVTVIGAGNSAGQAAMFLAECCPTRNVHMVIRHSLGPGMSSYLASRIRAAPNIVLYENSEVTALSGNRRIECVTVQDNSTRKQTELPCAAIFVFIGAEPLADWLPNEISRDKNGYLLVGSDVLRAGRWDRSDREPCPLETSLPGVLAAGDIRSGSTKRVGFAVGDGSLAVTCVHRLLSIRT